MFYKNRQKNVLQKQTGNLFYTSRQTKCSKTKHCTQTVIQSLLHKQTEKVFTDSFKLCSLPREIQCFLQRQIDKVFYIDRRTKCSTQTDKVFYIDRHTKCSTQTDKVFYIDRHTKCSTQTDKVFYIDRRTNLKSKNWDLHKIGWRNKKKLFDLKFDSRRIYSMPTATNILQL